MLPSLVRRRCSNCSPEILFDTSRVHEKIQHGALHMCKADFSSIRYASGSLTTNCSSVDAILCIRKVDTDLSWLPKSKEEEKMKSRSDSFVRHGELCLFVAPTSKPFQAQIPVTR